MYRLFKICNESLTVDLVRGVNGAAIIDAIATEISGNAKIRFFASELLAVGRVLDLRPNRLEALGTDGLVGHKEAIKRRP